MLTQNTITRIEQIVEEDRQTIKGAYDLLVGAIKNAENAQVVFNTCKMKIDAYKADTYYASKMNRLQVVKSLDTDVLVMAIFVTVLSKEGPRTIQELVGRLISLLEYDDVFESVITAGELIGVCRDTGLFTYTANPMMITSLFGIPQDAHDQMEGVKYPNPMLCKPNPWMNNNNGGYLSVCKSVLLGKHTHHNEKQCLDAVNILQTIQWELDPETLKYIEHKQGLTTQEEIDANQLLVRVSESTYKEIGAKPFYMVYRMDFRGRIYQSGYYINHQGNDYKRASLNFTKKQVLTR